MENCLTRTGAARWLAKCAARMTQIVLEFPKPQTVPAWASMLFSPLYSAPAAAEELLSMAACTAVRTGVPANGGTTPCRGCPPRGFPVLHVIAGEMAASTRGFPERVSEPITPPPRGLGSRAQR